ncbi:MAG: SMC-Scp complex subunit ScpB [Candidatus Kapabacteria bacterium]|nr:SMC-Scp complex subunit ScpB [Candidatus Kapabacteria bacterium]
MARQPYITDDPQLLKPVLEALIFASEEPLPPRMLIRLILGDQPDGKLREEPPPLFAEANGTEEAKPTENPEQPPTAEESLEAEAEDLAEAFEEAEARSAGRPSRSGRTETINQKYIRRLVEELNLEYDESGRAFRIVEVAGGFQYATIREYGEWVAMLSKEKLRRRLSPAALETLAIIAYRQPVSKPEIEQIRGVNCDQVLLSLLEKNLVAITGRSEGVGRPLLYGSSDDFLRCFGLNNVGDLPKLREIEELMEEDAFSAERAEVITVDEATEVAEIEARVGAAGNTPDQIATPPEGQPLAEVEITEGSAEATAPEEVPQQ